MIEDVEIRTTLDGERILAIRLDTLADHILDEDLVAIAEIAREVDLANRLVRTDPQCAREMLARTAVRRYEYLRRYPSLREAYVASDQLALRLLAEEMGDEAGSD